MIADEIKVLHESHNVLRSALQIETFTFELGQGFGNQLLFCIAESRELSHFLWKLVRWSLLLLLLALGRTLRHLCSFRSLAFQSDLNKTGSELFEGHGAGVVSVQGIEEIPQVFVGQAGELLHGNPSCLGDLAEEVPISPESLEKFIELELTRPVFVGIIHCLLCKLHDSFSCLGLLHLLLLVGSQTRPHKGRHPLLEGNGTRVISVDLFEKRFATCMVQSCEVVHRQLRCHINHLLHLGIHHGFCEGLRIERALVTRVSVVKGFRGILDGLLHNSVLFLLVFLGLLLLSSNANVHEALHKFIEGDGPRVV
mmetsp:Transcript_77486/g.136670  ORF Transcript_77486/g.136670 Transcript_77486/m.136670 type:complete len:311 (-) Transcript_77486:1650-2582(-)